jgi:hypothetical protein
MQFELQHWCESKGSWCRVEGPDYADLLTAVVAANQLATQSGKTIRVIHSWNGEVCHQTG